MDRGVEIVLMMDLEYSAGLKVGQAFQPDETHLSGWKA
jgi:hypothetical protein